MFRMLYGAEEEDSIEKMNGLKTYNNTSNCTEKLNREPKTKKNYIRK